MVEAFGTARVTTLTDYAVVLSGVNTYWWSAQGYVVAARTHPRGEEPIELSPTQIDFRVMRLLCQAISDMS